ncbi:hypothetical protein MIND_01275600 [Mycena indigotica]|uniref:Uncharacterized protein n=1 Tax=Mycena indigotica TaxID=2126181 RepID=A0A8H6S272_9AGAR|nr:uncharacterized protein MIND_01275600 [Mycena indigotica]KAF7291313.1 hypothetical protein MIND_01275600 [Mycena indigotica]
MSLPTRPRRLSSPGPRSSHIADSEPSLLHRSTPSESGEGESSNSAAATHGSPTPSFRERVTSTFHQLGHGHSAQTHPSPERVELQRLKERVGKAVEVIADHVLPIAADALEYAPVPGLALAAEVLKSIWESVQVVQSNQWRCLRLTERCADLLAAIRVIVHQSGENVAEQMEKPLKQIVERFIDIEAFVKGLTQMRFLQRYLYREEIVHKIEEYNTAITDSLLLFNASSTLRVLHQQFLQPTSDTQHAPLLLAPVVPSPVLFESTESLGQEEEPDEIDALDLAGLSAAVVHQDPVEMTDVSALRHRMHWQHTLENRRDHERDEAALGRSLKRAMTAPTSAVATRILQIPKAHMPAVMTLLLGELELQQARWQAQQTATNNTPGPGARARTTTSPSPHLRALTWPLDGLLARQAALLQQGFAEHELEAMKRAMAALCVTPPPPNQTVAEAASVLSGSIRRRDAQIQVYTPADRSVSSDSDSDSASESDPAFTAMTTPASGPFATLELPPDNPNPTEEEIAIDQIERLRVERALLPLETGVPAQTELLYRRSLSHAFHHLNVTLPLWTPSRVELGAVGYLKRPEGVFMTLFNSADPAAAGYVRVRPLPRIAIIREKQEAPAGHGHRGPGSLFSQGIKVVQHKFRANTVTASGAPSPASSTSNLSSQSGLASSGSDIERTYEFSAFGGTAHLITDTAEYRHWRSTDMEKPKMWFRQNISAILEGVPGGALLKQEIFLVYGTLNARDHAMLVSHGDPEELSKLQFNVYSTRQPGHDWGVFEAADAAPLGPQLVPRVSAVPDLHEVQKETTLLISRLRFRLDDPAPTAQ